MSKIFRRKMASSPETSPPEAGADSSPPSPPLPNSSPPSQTPPPDSTTPPSSPPPSKSPPPSSPPPSSPPPSSPPPTPAHSPPPSSPTPKTSPSSPPPHSESSPPPLPSSPPPNSPTPTASPPPVSPTPTQSPPPGAVSPSPPPPSTPIDPTLPSPLFSPPPPSTLLPPPPLSTLSPPQFPEIFTPPPPHAPGAPHKSTPPSSGTTSSGSSGSMTSSNSSMSSPPSNASTTAIIAGSAIAGMLLLAAIIFCVACALRRKKKRLYYMDPARPPKGTEYMYGSQQWNSPQSGLVVKLPPPPGLMGTPAGGVPGWGAPPPPPAAMNSSDYSSNYSPAANQTPLPPPSPTMGLGINQSTFTYEELAAATGGFSQANLLGQGGFGYVHKGVLGNGKEVAVKSLKSGSGQGEREFQAEVEIISRVHHRHLVSLVGYCIADGQRMLVYEFVPNKTLEFHLHGKGQPTMDWATRMRIALGSAKGLAYLHEDCHPKIIHRDIKAANILLDDKFEAMVADFGLAKLSSDNYTHVSTRVMGTFGYLAPEYASSGKLTDKSDVFSYGVMLLELITGRRPVDPTCKLMEDSLADWARPLLTRVLEDGNYDELVDPRLENNYVPEEMARMVACAAASIRHSARRRSKMTQIVRALEGDSSLEDLNEAPKPGQSAAYTPTDNSSGSYDTGAYNADMMKFRKMVMSSHDLSSSEYGATSEYGLNPSSSSDDSREIGLSGPQRKKF